MRISDVRVLGALRGQTLVEVETDDGLVGIGLTQAPEAAIRAIVELAPANLRGFLIGEDPTETRRLFRKMTRGWSAAYGRGSEGGVAMNAAAALDVAIWDLAGKAMGKPIWQLLGGAAQPGGIAAYASSSLFVSSSYEGGVGLWEKKSPDRLAEEARTYVRQGFRAMKFGWGAVEDGDEERVAAIRTAIGPAVRLMLDFGNPAYWDPHWNVAAAIRTARILERYDVYFWEEALQPHDVAGFRELSAAVDLNIATGESLTRIDEFDRFIDERAVDAVQPDAVQIGITQLVHVARRSEEAGILCIPHSPWSAVAVAAHLNVMATVANGPLIEYPALASFDEGSSAGAATAFFNFELVDEPVALVDGLLQLPTGPGLGVGGFRPEALARVAAGGGDGTWQ